MFGIGAWELILAGALVVALILVARHLSGAQWTRVDSSTPVGVDPTRLELPLARLLSNLPATRLVAGGGDTWTISVERAQPWALVPAVLLFPLGLLFLLFREHASLVVILRPAVGGAEVHLLGTTRLSVRRAVEQALADLPSATVPTGDATVGR